jgi:threonine dehydrogenase-like Zn-dependent dehydrogenase
MRLVAEGVLQEVKLHPRARVCGVPTLRRWPAASEDGGAAIRELTDGLGAHSVVEAVGTQESMTQAIRSTRAGGHVGLVGVGHGIEVPGEELFWSLVHVHADPPPCVASLPELVAVI